MAQNVQMRTISDTFWNTKTENLTEKLHNKDTYSSRILNKMTIWKQT